MHQPSEQEIKDVKRHVQHHLMIAGALVIGSLTTIWTSQTHFSSFARNVEATLGVAAIQAFLVAAYFMELLSQKKVIYSFLVFTALFFIVMMGITFWARLPENVIHYTK
jgi:heme/copper-type cytochrome/quinol oxidase subunit 4